MLDKEKASTKIVEALWVTSQLQKDHTIPTATYSDEKMETRSRVTQDAPFIRALERERGRLEEVGGDRGEPWRGRGAGVQGGQPTPALGATCMIRAVERRGA